jgi:FixJ family two-component response regulator
MLDKSSGLSTGQKPRVLIVEDDASVRRSMQLLLQGRGFDVRAYAAADTLLHDENIGEVACLVTDYYLGPRDGIGLLTVLRSHGLCSPAILVTAYSSIELRQAAEAAGFDEFLEKPFKEYALVNAVTRLTGLHPNDCEG